MRTFNDPTRTSLNLGARATFMTFMVVTSFAIIGMRLWFLQIIRGQFFVDQSNSNRLQTEFIPPPRGAIKDRHGELLVTNQPSFNIELIPENALSVSTTLNELSLIVGIDEKLLRERLVDQRRRKFEPKVLLRDVPHTVVAKVAANLFRIPGVIITVVPKRSYLYNTLAAHLMGYIREISQRQLDSPEYLGYRLGDLVGQSGLEAQWEQYLQGSRGTRRVIVNARGSRVGELAYKPEIQGHTLNLTIDRLVQETADKVLSEQPGAIVAMSPKTGEVFALASGPTFDPNVFTGSLTNAARIELNKDRKLFNRATQGTFPPGSVFKIITGLAALSEGVISPEDRITCTGGYYFAGRRFGCWKKTGHGSVNFHESLVQSCDVYYYVVSRKLGVDRIHKYASLLGLGQLTGIDIPEEVKGTVPSTAWKKLAFRKPQDKVWYPGETLSVAIGQGAVAVTPIQIARAIATLVGNHGLIQPYLVRDIEAVDGRTVVSTKTIEKPGLKIEDSKEIGPSFIDPEIYNRIRNALIDVVNSNRGTARRANLSPEFNFIVGGKTGTAQVAALHFGTKGKLNDHAWFVGFAPADDPEIVVAAIAENGGHGGAVAAPLVREVMLSYFKSQQQHRAQPKETE